MSGSQRTTRSLVLAIVILLAGACSAAPGSTRQPISSGSGGQRANLPDLALANVTTETANARAATIGSAGGTITAAAADGTTFSLVVPANAVSGRTTIAMYPVAHLNGMPSGESLTGGVQFSPDGLELGAAATLTITVPAGVDASKLAGIAWRGDGQGPIPVLSQANGQSMSMDVEHFSGAGAGTVPIAPIQLCDTEAEMYSRIEDDIHEAARNEPSASSDLKGTLRECYAGVVKPNLILESKGSIVDDVNEAQATVDAYDLWREGIDLGGGFFAGFTVSPELADSKVLAAAFLQNWFSSYNLECIGNADQPHAAVLDAYLALETPHAKAREWGIDTKANQLDYQSLLDKLCVQVVIDPARAYSGSKPGDKGTVTVPVGYSISGQAVRHDEPIDVRLTLAGESSPFADDDAPSDGSFTAPLTWPDGLDPLRIDVLASFDFGGNVSDLARFDRITKSSHSQIAFVGRAKDGSGRIYAIDSDGSNLRALTSGPHDDWPSWSPDGTKIAFGRATAGAVGYRIFVMNADGTDVHALTNGGAVAEEEPSWSPDGTRISFMRAGADDQFKLAIVDADGSNLVNTGIAVAGRPAWSPDGSRIAFPGFVAGTSGAPDTFALFAMSSDGSGAARLTQTGPVTVASPDWSPDGRQILGVCEFAGLVTTSLCLVNSTSGAVTNAGIPGSTTATWSPDGSEIAVATNASPSFQIVSLSGGQGGHLAVSGMQLVLNADWGP